MKRFLYLTWDGGRDPYLQTLFWPILRRLDEYRFDVLQIAPYEGARIRQTERDVSDSGGEYFPHDLLVGSRWWKGPLGIVTAAAELRKICARRAYDGFLVRSSLPAAILRLSQVLSSQHLFLFDADGFVQEERAEFAGWRRNGPAYRILNCCENWAVRRAHAVLVRTRRAIGSLIRKNSHHIDPAKIFLVLNGRDEKVFRPEERHEERPPRIFFAGSVGPQYCLEEMFRFFLLVKKRLPNAQFHFCTPQVEQARLVARRLLGNQPDLRIEHLQAEELASAMRQSDLGLALRRPSFSMQAVSPIKCGEYLLSGLPILAVQGTGDLDVNFAHSPSCLLLANLGEAELEQAADWFCRRAPPLKKDIRFRSRELGLKFYSMNSAIQSYRQAFVWAERQAQEFRDQKPMKKNRVVYLSHDGMLEPLGESQVVSYLEGLSPCWKIDLYSFEKPSDFHSAELFRGMQSRLASGGIRWRPVAYHNKPRNIAQAVGILVLILRLWWSYGGHPPQIAHARSYPAMLASLLGLPGKKTRKIFDMRGFWADEKISGGKWEKGSALFKLVKWAEAVFLRESDRVVCLTNAAASFLSKQGLSGKRLAVIPTCVDLEKFKPHPEKRNPTQPTLCFSGNLSGWYCQEEMFKAAKEFLVSLAGSRLLVLSREAPQNLQNKFGFCASMLARCTHRSVNFGEMPDWISRADLGLFFSQPAFSEIGRAPTKMAEFLACGVPVVTNLGIGDASRIVLDEGVGLVLAEPKATLFAEKLDAIRVLLADRNIASRCRQVAEKYFDLAKGIRIYDGIYRQLTENSESARFYPLASLDLPAGTEGTTKGSS